MALFGRKKEEKQETEAPAVKQAGGAQKPAKQTGGAEHAHVLIRPRITEKATMGTMRGVYVFEVAPGANKKEIAAAVRHVYKVNPVKIRTTPVIDKIVRSPRTGISGVKSGGKKAYVYLKKGESISLV